VTAEVAKGLQFSVPTDSCWLHHLDAASTIEGYYFLVLSRRGINERVAIRRLPQSNHYIIEALTVKISSTAE
jgi:hypothetical protein